MRITDGDRAHGGRRIRARTDESGQVPRQAADDVKHGPASGADRIEISGAARNMHAAHTDPAMTGVGGAQDAREPSLDPVQLEEIRAKIESGYYDTAEITRSIADRMLDLMGLKRPK